MSSDDRHRLYEPPGAASQTRALLKSVDWSQTPLGPISAWPRDLVGYVDLIMALPTPAIIFWGPEQTQIYNDGYAVIMGPRHPHYFGSTYRACWPDTYPLIYPHMRRVLDGGEIWSVERAHIPVTRYGFDEEAYFSFTFSPLRDDSGQIAGILQPVFDVSESVLNDRRAETLRSLVLTPAAAPSASFSSMQDALAVLQRNAQDLPFCRFWSRDPSSAQLSLVGHVGAILSEADERRLDGLAVDALAQGKIEIACERSCGWQAIQVIPLGAHSGHGIQGVIALAVSARLHYTARYREFLDLVARHCAAGLERDRARRAEERHRQYLDELFLQAPAGIAVTQGPDHIFELVNPTYEALTGQRGLVGRSLREALPALRDHPLATLLDGVYRTGRPYVGTELAVPLERGPGGEPDEAFFNFVYQPLHDDAGVTNGILIFSYEVTGQVQARLTAETLAAELRSEHRRKDDFLAMLAHELRNPLAPISAAAQMIRLGANDAERLRRTGEIVTRQVEHMTALIDDLLDASRVTRGIVTIARQPQDLRDIVMTAAEQVRPLIEHHRHQLRLDLGDTPAVVSGDRKRLVQVVANLLDNAAKYSPANSEISLVLAVAADGVTLRVADQGIGIAPALLPRVFDLFVQGERGADRQEGGLGIGLALVRSLVELHGGSITCASAGAGLGTEFSVHLPLGQAMPPADVVDAGDAPPGHPAPAQASRRVLIVDDNIDAAHSLAMLLEAAGHQTWVEHHPFSALQRAAETAPDTCLLDVGLPQMDGHELARRLRHLPQTEKAVLVAVTGYGQALDRKRASEAGFDHFFVKPLDFQALSALLER